jgi:NADPH:quinone reductase-like Zn-dependent oxidoreductase
MRAAVIERYGVPVPGEFPDPVAGNGHAVLEVSAAGLNPIDLAVAGGAIPALLPQLPAVAGWEAVGRLDGRRVYVGDAIAPYGSMAERTLVDPAAAVEVPDALSDGVAVALGIAGLAAWLPLSYRAALQRGEHVLVLGASGVVGQIAVQAARLLGAGRIVAAARSEAGLARARELGADATVSLAGDPATLADELRAASEGRLDVIVDPLWGEPAWAALQAASPFARLVQVGNSAGMDSPFDPAPLRGKLLGILPYSTTGVPREQVTAAYERMAEHATAGELRVEVEEIPLAEVATAWERQAAFPYRKLVIVP